MLSHDEELTISENLENSSEDHDLEQIWLNWHVSLDAQDESSLLSSNFELVKKEIKAKDFYKVSVPLLALKELAEKYNWLQVLRNSNHKPEDPYELVQFINLLTKDQ